jgi:hypothetical protein
MDKITLTVLSGGNTEEAMRPIAKIESRIPRSPLFTFTPPEIRI